MGEIIFIIKKYINSDLTKSLNTMIDEVKSTLALIKTKTDTITASLFTSTHAARIDTAISTRQADAGLTSTHVGRIDSTISSRADQATVNAIKAKTDLIGASSTASVIKSIQRGEASIPSGANQIVVTVNPVDMNKATLTYLGSWGAGEWGYPYMKLTSNNTILIKRVGTGDALISWELVEYY